MTVDVSKTMQDIEATVAGIVATVASKYEGLHDRISETLGRHGDDLGRLQDTLGEHASSLDRLHDKLDLVFRAIVAIGQDKGTDMTQLSDALAKAAQDNAAKAKAVIGMKTESETALQSVLDTINGTNKALDDAAASGDGGSNGSASTVTVAGPTPPAVTSVPISGASTVPVVGSTVAGDAIASGTTVQSGSTASTIILSQPTTAAHSGDGTETLTITAPADASGSGSNGMGGGSPGAVVG